MKIYIDILFIDMKIETIVLDITSNLKLKEAMKLVQEKCYIYPEEQIWFCNNNIIKTENIEWDNQSKYSILVNNKWYNFTIKTITNTSIEVKYLTSRDKISTIKYHIYEKIKLLPNNYTLTCITKNGTKELYDNDVIGKYFIPNGSTINLTIKLHSGFK